MIQACNAWTDIERKRKIFVSASLCNSSTVDLERPDKDMLDVLTYVGFFTAASTSGQSAKYYQLAQGYRRCC